MIQADFARAFKCFIDFAVIACVRFVGEIFPDIFRGWIVKTEVVVEYARTIDDKIVQAAEFITSNNEKLRISFVSYVLAKFSIVLNQSRTVSNKLRLQTDVWCRASAYNLFYVQRRIESDNSILPVFYLSAPSIF